MSTQSTSNSHDPRAVLVREKYFSLRPKPLEQWLWRQAVPPSAERVFWLHWEEGMRNGDWCSSVPIKRVASLTCLDVSTVTRAYQLLIRLGLVRREDPGRDPANPFQQATAITEVRVPRELLVELDRYPNRPSRARGAAPKAREGRVAPGEPFGARAAYSAPESPSNALPVAVVGPSDPFAGLSGRERVKALGTLTSRLSALERSRYDEALRTRSSRMAFDDASALSPEERGRVLDLLTCLAATPTAPPPRLSPPAFQQQHVAAQTPAGPRRLSVFELARLRREVQQVTGVAHAPEVIRQVLWSIEEGALRRFTSLHALHIALKKIREGAWTRPNRMPPNWARAMAQPETCRSA